MNKQNIVLSNGQKEVFNRLKDFILPSCTNKVFVLKGYAGTGKTTLIRFLLNYIEESINIESIKLQYILLASTGRAAKILTDNTHKDASTIHSLIYSFNGMKNTKKELEDEDGQLYLFFNVKKNCREDDIPTIYIVDESSMISNTEEKTFIQAKFGSGKLLEELLGYDIRTNSKFIFVGDPCQLPPINEENSPALSPEYFKKHFNYSAEECMLTEIMRQKLDNSIISASQKIRDLFDLAPFSKLEYAGKKNVWAKFPLNGYKDIQIYYTDIRDMISHYEELIKLHGYEYATYICYSNTSCAKVSTLVREHLGFYGTSPQPKELLLVIQNTPSLKNGDMVEVIHVDDNAKYVAGLTFRSIIVKELASKKEHNVLLMEDLLHSHSLNLDSHQQNKLFKNFIIRMKEKGITQKDSPELFNTELSKDPYLNALRCKFGYAITCHKSQGGEWEHVFVDIPSFLPMNPTKSSYQWLYTAITRAKTKLHLLNKFFIK